MKFLYLDESGDLGFSKASNDFELARCMKKARMKIFGKSQRESEIKASKSSDIVRIRILNEFLKTKAIFHYLVLNKSSLYSEAFNEEIAYNKLAAVILSEICKPRREIFFTVHKRRTNIKSREKFNEYLTSELRSKKLKFTLLHETAFSKTQLQIADHLSHVVFEYFERGKYALFKKVESKPGKSIIRNFI